MEFKLLEDKKNALFNRREMKLEIKEEIIPSKEKVKEELASKYSLDKEAIEILKISGKFGVKIFTILANVYDNKEEMNKTMLKSKKTRDSEAKALAEANKPQEGATQ
jgi:ribosomal protein S24E